MNGTYLRHFNTEDYAILRSEALSGAANDEKFDVKSSEGVAVDAANEDFSPDISVIIPVYNEQERIATTLYEVKDYLAECGKSFEILVIDDGSDDLTAEIVKFVDLYGSETKSQQVGRLEENVKNVGKGYSIAKGMLRARGKIVVFTDADGSTPISEIHKLLEPFDHGVDVVIGSRNLPDSNADGRTFIRSLLSRCFNMLARSLGLLTVRDSQCGFKAYSREAAHRVAEKQKTYGFCFDVEHLYIANKLGFKISEVPVAWRHQDGSTLSLLNDSLTMFCDLIRIRLLHRSN